MTEAILAAALLTAGYFAFRWLTLRKALLAAERELREIQGDWSQNRFLHLPLPDAALERLIGTVNAGLEKSRGEWRSYEKRERQFQQQIENISHDLRTPLTVILGYLQWMKEGAKGASGGNRLDGGGPDFTVEERAQLLTVLERNARAMERLVGQFYLYSQLHAQDYPLTMALIDVGRLLKETLLANEQALSQAYLKVSCEIPQGAIMAWADGEALERVFTNLLQNAARYAAGRLSVCLRVNAAGSEEAPGGVEFIFANDTDSLSPEEIPLLFERFYRQDKARAQGGSGLGLTVARELAEAMGGTLTAELLPAQESCGGGKAAGKAEQADGGLRGREAVNAGAEANWLRLRLWLRGAPEPK